MTALTLLSLLLLSSVSWSGIEAKRRLENNLAKPSKYVLELEPDFQKILFEGSVTITLTVDEVTAVLILNQKNLYIHDVVMVGNLVKYYRADHHMEMLTIYFKQDLKPGVSYTLKIHYHAILNDQKQGFYRSRYFIGNDIRWIATTHFEPTGARLAFPCWDEPEYKAIFDISIKHLSNYTAVVSNMPVKETNVVGNKTVTTFESTNPMSTYLVAFVVSDYHFLEHDKNKNYRMYTKADSVNKTKYALDFSVKAMEQLGIVTGIPYSRYMPKMDQITIKDFSPGAMENWGLVTYREKYLLYEDGVTPTVAKESMVTTIAHEFTHQWFGNLVSPKWWEYLWLNEGFATYFQYYITDKVEPTWELMEFLVVEAMQGTAFPFDGIVDTRPMNEAVDSPSEIKNLFDNIAYQKAACVIRMMSNILTEKVFLKGLNSYLTKNKFNVADSDELIKNLQAAAGNTTTWGGVKLEEIMKSWFTKPGYPVVTVKKNNTHYVLSQERYLYYGSDEVTKWWIPITYVTEKNLNFSTNTPPALWLKPNEESSIPSENADWILLNKQQTGYYRVNYEDENWKKISEYLVNNFKKIHVVNRANLIDDAFNLARKNLTNYQIALNLTLYLKNETGYIPWMSTFRNLNFLNNKISTSNHYDIFKFYLRYIMQSLTKNVTYEASAKDPHVTKILKATAIKWACKADVEECLNYTKKEFDTWYKDSKYLLDADLKSNILCTGLRHANEAVWSTVLQRLANSTNDKQERDSLLGVMGCSENRTILEKLISMSLEPKRYIELDAAVEAIVSNNQISKTRNVSIVGFVLEKLKKEYKNIMKMEGAIKKILSCISSLSSAAVDKDDVTELQKFITSSGFNADTVASSMLNINRNMDWVTAYRDTVDNWLVEHEHHFKLKSGTGTVAFTSFLLILSIFVTRFY